MGGIKLVILSILLLGNSVFCKAQHSRDSVFLVPTCEYNGERIPCVQLPNVYIFKPIKFKNEKQKKEYDKLIRDVKKTLPIAKEVRRAIIETYEYLETLPTEKEKDKHIKAMEKGLKEQYTPRLKKLTFSQGKLLIKLIDREANQSSYQLVKAFLGPFKAGFYQTFAGLFGASLRKEYDPEGADAHIERIVLQVESGQL